MGIADVFRQQQQGNQGSQVIGLTDAGKQAAAEGTYTGLTGMVLDNLSSPTTVVHLSKEMGMGMDKLKPIIDRLRAQGYVRYQQG